MVFLINTESPLLFFLYNIVFYRGRPGPVPLSENTSLYVTSIFRCLSRPSFTSFISVSRFQHSLSLPFFKSRYIVSFSPPFLFPYLTIRATLYLSLTFCYPCHSLFVSRIFLDRFFLRLSPIFLANSFLCLLPLPVVYMYLRLPHDNSSINKRPFVKSTCSCNIKTLSQLMRHECIRRPGHANKL